MATASLQGGYECQFVDPPKELQSECPICLHVIREPYLVDCCGYRFCRTCIKNIQEKSGHCPLCNAEFITVPDRFLQRTLDQKQVTCTYEKSGCTWIGELRELDQHQNLKFDANSRLEGCAFIELKCKYCTTILQRQDIEVHETDCPQKPVLCNHCKKYTSSMEEMINKHWPMCPSYPVPCSNSCGKFCKRVGVGDHIKNHCPLTVVSCEFHTIGCPAAFSRQHTTEHMESDALHHVTLLSRHCKDLAKMVESLTSENEKLKEEKTGRDEKASKKPRQSSRKKQKLPSDLQAESCHIPSQSSHQKASKRDVKTAVEPSPTYQILLVTNCAPGTNEQNLRSTFGAFGRVLKVEWNAKVKYAFIHYSDPECVQRALVKYRRSGIKLLKSMLELYPM